MPCSQMMSMNCRPPRAMEARRPAALPAVKAWMRKRLCWNIGSAIRPSMTTNTASRATPAISSPYTEGSVQLIVCRPDGWMPSVTATRTADSPAANVMLPHQSIRAGCRLPLSRSLR
jgi:hypothetical protein